MRHQAVSSLSCPSCRKGSLPDPQGGNAWPVLHSTCLRLPFGQCSCGDAYCNQVLIQGTSDNGLGPVSSLRHALLADEHRDGLKAFLHVATGESHLVSMTAAPFPPRVRQRGVRSAGPLQPRPSSRRGRSGRKRRPHGIRGARRARDPRALVAAKRSFRRRQLRRASAART